MISNARWRARLRPASFRGAQFKIEASSRRGGRRVAFHEFPKRDDPYAEDMGRRGRRFQVTGYIVGENYMLARDMLIRACEQEGPGMLIFDRLGEFLVVCEQYGVSETRERGGICEFDLVFLEAGVPPSYAGAGAATQQGATNAGNAAAAASTGALGNTTVNASLGNTSAGAFGTTGPIGADGGTSYEMPAGLSGSSGSITSFKDYPLGGL